MANHFVVVLQVAVFEKCGPHAEPRVVPHADLPRSLLAGRRVQELLRAVRRTLRASGVHADAAPRVQERSPPFQGEVQDLELRLSQGLC